MGWLFAGLVIGWFVPQPDWKKLGARIAAWWVARQAK